MMLKISILRNGIAIGIESQKSMPISSNRKQGSMEENKRWSLSVNNRE